MVSLSLRKSGTRFSPCDKKCGSHKPKMGTVAVTAQRRDLQQSHTKEERYNNEI